MIKLRDDVVFEDPQSRIREYCEIEVCQGYDDKHSVNHAITQRDIDAANELYAMIDRYDKGESRRLLGNSKNISSLLSSIPNMDIYAVSNKEWLGLRSKIEKLFVEFLSIKGIGLAKATKILHLKRPNLIPILDSFVIKFLLDVNISDEEKGNHVDIGLKTLDRVREIITNQRVVFEKLVEQTQDLPIQLTPVRMFDILCWTAEKWDIRRILNAPYGVPNKSLLFATSLKPRKDIDTTPDNFFKDNRYKLIGRDKRKPRDNGMSSAKSIVVDFVFELCQRAKYGLRGEKPLALIAALKYLYENKIVGKPLLVIFDDPDANKARKIFIDLAKRHGRISEPSNSWNVITGKNRELQNAIQQFGNVDQAFSKLTFEEIELLLKNYMKKLEKF